MAGHPRAVAGRLLTVEVNTGSTISIGPYQLKVGEMTSGKNENYQWGALPLEVSSGGRVLGTLHPERRFYPASEQPTSEVSIRRFAY